jgi:hypothetical protein
MFRIRDDIFDPDAVLESLLEFRGDFPGFLLLGSLEIRNWSKSRLDGGLRFV